MRRVGDPRRVTAASFNLRNYATFMLMGAGGLYVLGHCVMDVMMIHCSNTANVLLLTFSAVGGFGIAESVEGGFQGSGTTGFTDDDPTASPDTPRRLNLTTRAPAFSPLSSLHRDRARCREQPPRTDQEMGSGIRPRAAG